MIAPVGSPIAVALLAAGCSIAAVPFADMGTAAVQFSALGTAVPPAVLGNQKDGIKFIRYYRYCCRSTCCLVYCCW